MNQWQKDLIDVFTWECEFEIEDLFEKGIMMAFEDKDYYYIYTDPRKEEGYMDPCPTGLDNPNPLWVIGKRNGLKHKGSTYALLEVCEEAQRPGTEVKQLDPPFEFVIG